MVFALVCLREANASGLRAPSERRQVFASGQAGRSAAPTIHPFIDLSDFFGFLNLSQLFQLAVPIELADEGGILAPVRLNLDKEFEEDFRT